MELTPIAHIENDFPTKFGLPRQSGMAEHLTSAIVMEPPFRVGVFATRSPNRPNPIGLTRVRLLALEHTADKGVVLTVSGADLMNGTAILDIKPYLPFADSVPDAMTGAYGPSQQEPLAVVIPEEIAALFSPAQLDTLREVLAYDPRPGYQTDPDRQYGFGYAGYDVRFIVKENTATVTDAVKIN